MATINFSFTEVRRLFEGGVYSRAAFILPAGLDVSRHAPSAHVNFVLGLSCSHLRARWLTRACPVLLFISDSWPSCVQVYRLWSSRARQSRESSLSHVGNVTGSTHLRMRIAMRLLFKGGHYYAQLVFCAAPIRGQRLFGVRRLFKEIRYPSFVVYMLGSSSVISRSFDCKTTFLSLFLQLSYFISSYIVVQKGIVSYIVCMSFTVIIPVCDYFRCTANT